MLTEDGKRKKADLEAKVQERMTRGKNEQRALLSELLAVGVKVDMVNLLPMIPTKEYTAAIPILARHLHTQYSEATLESIARALATQEAKDYWDDLRALYVHERNRMAQDGGDFEMGLAAAIAASCPPNRLGELIELIRNQELPHRVLLLNPLRRRRGKDAKIAELLDELRRDPALAREINSWKILPAQSVARTH